MALPASSRLTVYRYNSVNPSALVFISDSNVSVVPEPTPGARPGIAAPCRLSAFARSASGVRSPIRRSHALPSPLWGEGWGWGSGDVARRCRNLATPHPDPPPQGGRMRRRARCRVGPRARVRRGSRRKRPSHETSPARVRLPACGCRTAAAGDARASPGASLPTQDGADRGRVRGGRRGHMTARLIGQWLSERLGQWFVVENRPGAGGNIGTEAVVNAPPDGWRCIVLATVPNAVNATLYPKLNFNFMRDTRRSPASSGCRWWCSSIRRCRRRPFPNSSPTPRPIRARSTWPRPAPAPRRIMAGELFKTMAGVNLVHVPYRGQGRR